MRLRRTAIILVLALVAAGLAVPALPAAAHGGCTVTAYVEQEPPTILDRNPPITYGAAMTCTYSHSQLEIWVGLYVPGQVGAIQNIFRYCYNARTCSIEDVHEPTWCGVHLSGVQTLTYTAEAVGIRLGEASNEGDSPPHVMACPGLI